MTRSNILVCGGLPRAGTTFVYTELKNYTRVHRSLIKESFLFQKPGWLVDFKLKCLGKGRIVLDFTPEYIFDRAALQKLIERQVPCFFILRDFDGFKNSLNTYLQINQIKNPNLQSISKEQFEDAVLFVSVHFLTFRFETVIDTPETVVATLASHFDLDFGIRKRDGVKRNSSSTRQHHVMNQINNVLGPGYRWMKAFAMGWI